MGEPRERPILFSAPMVRALLDGRKTQTRRVLRPQPPTEEAVKAMAGDGFSVFTHRNSTSGRFSVAGPVWAVRDLMQREPEWYCPYGRPGDRLWVRETWGMEDCGADGERVIWQADREAAWRSSMASRFWLPSDHVPGRWRPSIHMPRWASRLSLKVADVRVERLEACSEDDAWAEGALADRQRCTGTTTADLPSARHAFRRLWESINGPESWKANPWVWVVSFTRVESGR